MSFDPLPDFEPLHYFIKSVKHKIPIRLKSVCHCQKYKRRSGLISLLIYTFSVISSALMCVGSGPLPLLTPVFDSISHSITKQ